LSGELVTQAARVVVELLPAWFADFAPPAGSVVGVDFGEGRAWSWERQADGWIARTGIDRGAAARLVVVPASAAVLLSRGLSAEEAARHVTIEGDEDLASGVVDIALPLMGRPPP
jgi:hypothetical protein